MDVAVEILNATIMAEGVTMGTFGVALRHEGESTYLTCVGQMSRRHAENLRCACEIALATQPRELIVDTSRVYSIGPDGIHVLVEGFALSYSIHATWTLVPGPIVADALEHAGFTWLLDPAVSDPDQVSGGRDRVPSGSASHRGKTSDQFDGERNTRQ